MTFGLPLGLTLQPVPGLDAGSDMTEPAENPFERQWSREEAVIGGTRPLYVTTYACLGVGTALALSTVIVDSSGGGLEPEAVLGAAGLAVGIMVVGLVPAIVAIRRSRHPRRVLHRRGIATLSEPGWDGDGNSGAVGRSEMPWADPSRVLDPERDSDPAAVVLSNRLRL